MTNKEYTEYTDRTIAELVYDKWELQKLYNYYNCKRDPEQFKYLEENFGIGNPTSVEFIPLIKKHIDVLVGEYLETPIIPKVTCKDRKTIAHITREKQLKITESVFQFLISRLKNVALAVIGSDVQATDPSIQHDLEDLIEDLNYAFQSEYEVAAQNVIQYLLQSRSVDIKNKIRILITDLLIGGIMYYRARPTINNTNVQIEVLNPLNTFIDRNPNSIYVKDSYRVVIRKWLPKQEILNIYGKDLSKNDIKSIKERWEWGNDYSAIYVRNYTRSDGYPVTEGLRAGQELTPGFPYQDNVFNYNLIPVYEVEWIETDKNFVMQRHRTVRIGDSIYIIYGKDTEVQRSSDNPSYCGLSVNGVFFLNRDNQPYSMVRACMKLQDKYDLAHYYRDSLMANSGTKGDFLDISMLPKFLGDKIPERMKKWIAYKKQGLALLDTSQEGRLGGGQAPINTIFNGFDDSLRGEAIQACQLVIDSIEQTCSSITGVFRERLNGIQQRDAVNNVKVSVNNSYNVTKQYTQQMDTCVEEILLDSLNVAKVVYKKGLTGVLILGEKQQKIFTALPEHFTMTDYDIHVVNSSDITKDMEQLRALIPEFIKAGSMDAEIAVEAATTKSYSQLKQDLHTAIRRQEKKNGQLQQTLQQLQELQQQLQQTQQQLQKAEQKVQQLNEAKLQIEKEKAASDAKIEMYKAQTDRTYKESITRNDNRRTEIELAQIHDGNPYNDEVVNVRH